MSRPGAFTAVACTGTIDRSRDEVIPIEALRPLPCGVLCHNGHDPFRGPIAVAVPKVRDEMIVVTGVFSARATRLWSQVTCGTGVSIAVQGSEWRGGRLLAGVLVAVDFVRRPADPGARVTSVTAGEDMTRGQRRTQELFDQYVADPASALGVDFSARAARRGVLALDDLAPVVEPLEAELTRQLTGAL